MDDQQPRGVLLDGRRGLQVLRASEECGRAAAVREQSHRRPVVGRIGGDGDPLRTFLSVPLAHLTTIVEPLQADNFLAFAKQRRTELLPQLASCCGERHS